MQFFDALDWQVVLCLSNSHTVCCIYAPLEASKKNKYSSIFSDLLKRLELMCIINFWNKPFCSDWKKNTQTTIKSGGKTKFLFYRTKLSTSGQKISEPQASLYYLWPSFERGHKETLYLIQRLDWGLDKE